MHGRRVCSLVPRLSVGGEEIAWYPLFAHALNFQEILGNRKLLCYIHITMTTYRILTATSSTNFVTNDESVSIARSPWLSSSLVVRYF